MKMLVSFLLSVTMLSAQPAKAAATVSCISDKLSASLQVFEEMRAAGLDLNKPRSVSQLFVGPDSRLRKIIHSLRASGYSIEEQSGGRLLARTSVPLSDPWIRSTISQMCAAAASADVEYDGWDVDVQADNISSDKAR